MGNDNLIVPPITLKFVQEAKKPGHAVCKHGARYKNAYNARKAAEHIGKGHTSYVCSKCNGHHLVNYNE